MIPDEKSAEILTDVYKPVKVLGKGSYGITLECATIPWEDDNVVVKIQTSDRWSRSEFYMTQFINQIRINIPDMPDIFTHTLRTFTSNKIPKEYLDFIMNTKNADYINFVEKELIGSPYIFIIMSKNDYTLHDLHEKKMITNHQAIAYVFILLTALMKLREYYPYVNHRDIKSDNIMFVKIDKPITIENFDSYIEINVPFFPKLIDYGRMTNSAEIDCNRIEYEEFNYFVQEPDGRGRLPLKGELVKKFPPTNDPFRIVDSFKKIFPETFKSLFFMVSKETEKYAKESAMYGDNPWQIYDKTYINGSEPIARLINQNYNLFRSCHYIKFPPPEEVEVEQEQESETKKAKFSNALCNTCYRQGVTMMYDNTVVPCFFCNQECEKKFGQVKYLMEIKK